MAKATDPTIGPGARPGAAGSSDRGGTGSAAPQVAASGGGPAGVGAEPIKPEAALARHIEWLDFALNAATEEEAWRRERLAKATRKNRAKRQGRLAEVVAEITELRALLAGIRDLQTRAKAGGPGAGSGDTAAASAPRRRGRPPGSRNRPKAAAPASAAVQVGEPVIKRGPGRPRKNPLPTAAADAAGPPAMAASPAAASTPPVKRGPGRPRKVPIPPGPVGDPQGASAASGPSGGSGDSSSGV